MSVRVIPPIGTTFSCLTVVSSVCNERGKSRVLCRCVCGNEKEYRVGNLKSGIVKSCGCVGRILTVMALTKSGARSKEAVATGLSGIYKGMVARCYNPKTGAFHRYGGRGIQVCKRWLGLSGFENFLLDMGKRPSPDHSLERKDNDGNYEPDNCIWATRLEQANNTRQNRHISIGGETRTLAQWSRKSGINWFTINSRIESGWSEDDLLAPVKPRLRRNVSVEQTS